jgi:hypothetical protein
MTAKWLPLLLAAAGFALLALAFPETGRTAEPARKAGYQLLVCPPAIGVECQLHGKVLASATACSLDMASLAVVLNKGTRISCVRVGEDRR